MSIIYEALKKVENKDKGAFPKRNKTHAISLILSFIGIIFIIILGNRYFKNKAIVALAKTKKVDEVSNQKIKKNGISTQAAIRSQVNHQLITEKTTASLEGPSDYVLEGIIFDSESPLAIINGKILKTQDKIDDWQVTGITPNSVQLHSLKDNTTFSLKL